MNTSQGAEYDWNYIDRDLDLGATRRPAKLAAQPKLGYYPSGGLGFILFIVVILLLLGRI